MRRIRASPWLAGAPLLVIFGLAFGLTAIWARSVHTFAVMPDELGYVKQALEIAQTGLPVGSHSFWFNSWAQLLPVLSAPVFGGLGMVDAYYTAHTLYAFLLTSTAIPVYLLAQQLGLGRLGGYLAAALSVAIPWLVYAGLIMTEVVAYPVFAWALLAIVRALQTPRARRDLIAIVAVGLAFFARTQFVVLAPVFLLSTIVHDLPLGLAQSDHPVLGRGLTDALRWMVNRHRVLFAIAAAVVVALAALAATGDSEAVFGSYITPLHGSLLPHGSISAGLLQLDAIALAVGVLPVTASAAWALTSLIRPRDPARRSFAALLVVLIPVLVLMVGSFAEKTLDGNTTDRYLFYLIPVLFVGTAAWVVDRGSSWKAVIPLGMAVAWLVVVKTLHYETAISIINPSYAVHRVFIGQGYRLDTALGIGQVDPRVLLAIAASGFTLLALVARRWLPHPWSLLVVMVPLLAYGVATTMYAMDKVRAELDGVPASHPRELTWIDRTVPSGARVGLVLAALPGASPQDPTDTEWNWWQMSFWNKTVNRVFVLPGADTFAQGFVGTISPNLSRGTLMGVSGVNYLLKMKNDTRFGLRAPVIAAPSQYDVDIYRISPTTRLLWATSGVDEYGSVVPRKRQFVRIYNNDGSGATTERVTLVLQVVEQSGCPCGTRLGARYGQVRLPAATLDHPRDVKVTRTVAIRAQGFAQLDLTTQDRLGGTVGHWLKLLSVQVSP